MPHPAWGLVFVALALFDFAYALSWLQMIGSAGATPQLALRLQADIAWGLFLALLLTGVWFWASSRDLRPALLRFVQRRPRASGGGWLGVLFIALLYTLTFAPVVFYSEDSLAGRELAAVPLDIAMAVIMFDLRRLQREAWKILRELQGEAAPSLSPEFEAVRNHPELAALRPEDLREAPRWYYNLPGLLGVIQGALLLVGAAQIPLGWSGETRMWHGLPWEVPLFGAWGVAIGLWGVWHEARQLRRPGRDVQIALRAILKDPRGFPFYFWDWWGYTVILLALAAGLVAIFPLQEQQMRLAGGALAAGYGLGITPLYPYYAKPWRLAGEILRMVRG